MARGTWERCLVFEDSPGNAARDVHDVAEQLRSRRRRLGLTQSQVAEQARIVMRSVHQIESGSSCPSSKSLGALAFGLGARLGGSHPDFESPGLVSAPS